MTKTNFEENILSLSSCNNIGDLNKEWIKLYTKNNIKSHCICNCKLSKNSNYYYNIKTNKFIIVGDSCEKIILRGNKLKKGKNDDNNKKITGLQSEIKKIDNLDNYSLKILKDLDNNELIDIFNNFDDEKLNLIKNNILINCSIIDMKYYINILNIINNIIEERNELIEKTNENLIKNEFKEIEIDNIKKIIIEPKVISNKDKIIDYYKNKGHIFYGGITNDNKNYFINDECNCKSGAYSFTNSNKIACSICLKYVNYNLIYID
jgi:hypothetical protein